MVLRIAVVPLALLAAGSASSGCVTDGDPATFSASLAGDDTAGAAPTQVTVSVDTAARGRPVPSDFSGLSFEMGSLLPDHAGITGYLFDGDNRRVLGLLRQIGVRNLRLGGGSVDQSFFPRRVAGEIDFEGIDRLFDFARVAGMNVIYSVRMLNGDADEDAAVIEHIWKLHRELITGFAVGNEPDWRSYHYPPAGTGPDPEIVYYKTSVANQGYIEKWRELVTTITGRAPGTPFVGPDTGSNWPVSLSPPYAPSIDTTWNNVTWTSNFGADVAAWKFPNQGELAFVTLHNYPGQSVTFSDGGVKHTLTTQQMIGGMLSPDWVGAYYPALYQASGSPALPAGVGYRLTESNPFTGAIDGGSNCFATALWALDYMHWWAAHDALGINFHNKQWGANNVLYWDGSDYRILPVGYGMKAWDLGSHGFIEPVDVSNPAAVNLTAYAVGAGNDLFVTLVNKEHGNGSEDARVTIDAGGFAAASAASMVLTDGKRGDASLLEATLGGAHIDGATRWSGAWEPLPPASGGSTVVTVPAASAAVVHLRRASAYAGPIAGDGDGGLTLAGADGEHQVWLDRQSLSRGSASDWDGWAPIEGPGSSAGSGVTATTDVEHRIALFSVGDAGEVYGARQDQAGDFSWTDLGGERVADLRVARGADGALNLFAAAEDGVITTAVETAPGGEWSAWEPLDGAAIEPGFVVGRDGTGRLELVGFDADATLWHDRQTADGWSGWERVEGPPAVGLAAATNLDGRLEVFAVDRDGALWHAAQEAPGGAWQPWSPLGDRKVQPGFVVGQAEDGRLAVVAVDTRQHVVTALQKTPGGAPGDWIELEGPPMKARLAVATAADGRMQLFATGLEGAIYQKSRLAQGDGWGSWTELAAPDGVALFPGDHSEDNSVEPPDEGGDEATSAGCGASGNPGAPAAGLLLVLALAWRLRRRARRPL